MLVCIQYYSMYQHHF